MRAHAISSGLTISEQTNYKLAPVPSKLELTGGVLAIAWFCGEGNRGYRQNRDNPLLKSAFSRKQRFLKRLVPFRNRAAHGYPIIAMIIVY